MKKITKQILIWTFVVIGFGIIGYVGFVGYVLYSFGSGCGMDDGPFKAVLIDPVELTTNTERFEVSDNGTLILENRNDTLSPIFTLVENGNVKWRLDTDTRNTKGYESTRIWKISSVEVTKDTDPIKLNFTAHWTYGAEAGSIQIDREDGENSFCLSW
ncbi:hypothetical protein [Aquimarina intermedia]|uniref:Uncharacterized protein n=1 Tax=Aquimarina intermedia TaxID=350814 RepID=A0A5S5BYY1_9FLAO|nr:hypothetical protein [Aquimarina intermedia]TYP70883.1 hypothetical protein BD809_11151 [Aquimarina intermedia]